MLKTRLSAIAVAAMLVPMLHAAPALAQNAKSWVANYGSDGNTCTLALPCATFQRAHDQTNSGGEIGVLTPGDYGGTLSPRLAINKSINITNDGSGDAGILSSANNIGISINAAAGAIVSLRGLVVDGLGGGNIGVDFLGGSALHVQNCVIRNFQGAGGGYGINFNPHGHSQLFLSDTIIFNNGSGANSGGMRIATCCTSGTSADAVLDRVHLENNVFGVRVDGNGGSTGPGAHVVVRDSVVSGNVGSGIIATTVAGQAPAFIFVERSSSVNNVGTGILADGPRATIVLNDNTITRNGAGMSATNGGQLISFGNNKNANNLGPEGAPTGLYNQM
jgi:hypothetical protein